jgi:hypothetical protein
MPAINFEAIFGELKESIVTLAKISFKKLSEEAAEDGKRLLEDMKEKLERWTILLAQGKLTTEDFEMLVLNQKDLVQMHALRQAGLAAIKAEQFRDGVINIVVDTITNVVGL